MNEDFVTFGLAKKLKEKGFTCEIPFAMYNELGEFLLLVTSAPYRVSSSGEYKYREYYDYNDFDEYDCVAPTISQVLKWLREEKKIHVEILIHQDLRWGYEAWDISEKLKPFGNVGYNSYAEYNSAALAGIEYTLDNLI